MRRLAFSTNAFKKHPLEEAVRTIARAGYSGVEIMADLPHLVPRALSRADRLRIRSLIADAALQVSNINAFTQFVDGDTYHPTWIEEDPQQRQKRIDHTLACIELAADLECASISLQPGGPLIGTGLSWDQAARRFAEGLSQVLPAARQKGVVLAIEPEPGLLIQTAEEYRRFKALFFPGEPLIGMNCDVGHLFCVGEDPAETIRTSFDQIVHVHLDDIGENRVHQHLPLGQGCIDFRAVFAAIERIGYKGWVTVELYPYEATAGAVAEAAFEYVKTIW